MNCPNCSADRDELAFECASCGIVFSKWVSPQFTRKAKLEQARDRLRKAASTPHDGRIGRTELLIMIPGLVLAMIVYAVPFLRFVFHALITLFHEFGHAVAGWLLGYPSIPAFDFAYGGGVTPHGEFRLSIVLAIAGGFAWAAYLYRRNTRTLIVLGAIFLIWLFFASAEWRRQFVFSAAGHATELILAAIFFYMALAGVGFRIPELERPLAAFVAFFVTISSIQFARQLRADPDFLAWYIEGKRGMMMDLESISLDMRIHTPAVNLDVPGVAGWLMVFSIIPFGIALLWYFNRVRAHRLLAELLKTDV